ncbi:MAG: PepSY-associated TM helix domain-containing protein [Alphaproteobacteria bacterium]
MKARAVGIAYRWHRVLGGVLAAIVFTLSLSGAMSVFKDDLETWTLAARITCDSATVRTPEHAMRLFETLADSSWSARRLELHDECPGPTLRLKDGRIFAVGTDGVPIRIDGMGGIADFLVNYHTRLFLGREGRWLVGILGIGMLGSLVTGVIVHHKILRQLFSLRLGRSLRLLLSDLHKLLGSWTLPFTAVIAITGIWLGVANLFVNDEALIRAAAAKAPVPAGLFRFDSSQGNGTSRPNLDRLVVRARSLLPGFEPVFIDFRDIDGAPAFTVAGNLRGALFRRHVGGAVFDDRGRALARHAPGDLSSAVRLHFAAAPLHFGDFSGIGVRVLYAVSGLFAAALVAVGASLRWERFRYQEPDTGIPVGDRVTGGAMAGSYVATLALPALAVSTGLGPSFAGGMRLGQIFDGSAAPVLGAFLGLWMLSALGFGLARSPRSMWRAALLCGAGLFAGAVAIAAWPMSAVTGGFASQGGMFHEVTLVLGGLAALQLLAALSLMRAVRRQQPAQLRWGVRRALGNSRTTALFRHNRENSER